MSCWFSIARSLVPAIGRLNQSVSEATTRVVEKTLAKRPEDRYPDAAALLRDLEALRHGKPTAISLHPRLPECNPHEVIAFDWAWELEASPRQLWPHVSNTERVNRALGLAAPEFTTRNAPDGGVERYAGFRQYRSLLVAGTSLRMDRGPEIRRTA